LPSRNDNIVGAELRNRSPALRFKVPRYVRFLDYIPKSIIGKVTKKDLKQQMLNEMNEMNETK
jgi:non-ribosomal peptide synthetase component E (peptide arylation enzyme)